MEEKKASIGRQKIEIKKIEKTNARDTCFTKRRNGLFKKASKLCINCDAQVAIVAFSRAGKAYSFGHPSVDSVVDRFLVHAKEEEEFEDAIDRVCSVNIDELGLEELERYHEGVIKIREFVRKKLDQISLNASSSST